MPYGSTTARGFVLASWLGSDKRSGAPTTLYFALFTTIPGGDEGSGGSYARVAITNNDSLWDITAEVATNLVDITWPMSTASQAATEFAYWAVYDASTAGNCWAYGLLTDPFDVTVAGRVAVIAIGDLVITQGE